MVDSTSLIKLRQLVIFAVLLAAAAIAIAILARFRTGLIALRAGFAVFNVLSFFYCLSLVGQKAWETSARIANAIRHAAKEPSDVECN
jgi:hypothetical protein